MGVTPTSDQNRIYPQNVDTIIILNKQEMGLKKNFNLGIFKRSSSILQTKITKFVWQTVRRITNEILGVEGLA